MEVEEILPHIQHRHVVITGGEPTYWDLTNLIGGIDDVTNNTAFIQMETSGHKELKFNSLLVDWITWSPKRNIDFAAPESFRMLVNEVKFVVDSDLSFSDVEDVIKGVDFSRHGITKCLTFMAEGCPPTAASLAKAIEFAKEFDGAAERVMVSDRFQYRAEVR